MLRKKDLKPISSLENVPKNLRGLADDIVLIAEQIYGKENIAAIYWHGSIPRGDFVKNESDADLDIITHKTPVRGHRKKRQILIEKILPKWEKLGIADFDVVAIGKDELHHKDREADVFFCATDSIKIAGDTQFDLNFSLPNTTQELVTLLSGSFKLWIQYIKGGELSQQDSKRQIQKRTVRAIYGLAMLNGAPYQRNWRKYETSIMTYLPNYSKTYKTFIEGGLKLTESLKIADQVCADLAKAGITLKESWD